MRRGRLLFLAGALLAFGLAAAPGVPAALRPLLAWLPGGMARDPARLLFLIGIVCALAFGWGRGGG
ncbi:MAG TPA: hypothetical protein VMG58_08620 [Candidatus Sulfotelmatobacter sp.]|nr:hypothetical protein [Candidatus Sulfotelmatobacter sp.]